MPLKDKVAEAEYQRAYRERNKEKLRAQAAQWRARNAEMLKIKKREDYLKNSDAYKARAGAADFWKKKFYRSMKKARNAGALIVSVDSIREYYRQVFSKETDVCSYCRGRFDIKDISVDHKKPYASGGRHEVSNFIVSCICCNVSKHTYDYESWMAMR